MSTSATAAGDRFAFGRNWRDFVSLVGEERIAAAEASLRAMLERESLDGLSFLDVGCGSGLFSLAAARLGAARVHSLDFDPDSVAATTELRDRFRPEADWTVERGDVLDADYMARLGSFDVVYSWGVLHHTGDLWRALEHAQERVAPGGRLFIAIYNDQGRTSRAWRAVKRTYNRLPGPVRPVYAGAVMAPWEAKALAGAVARREIGAYVRRWRRGYDRGMSRWHDIVDWVGGYPFEVAKPDEILAHCRAHGFALLRLVTCGGGLGCNEFVLAREGEAG